MLNIFERFNFCILLSSPDRTFHWNNSSYFLRTTSLRDNSIAKSCPRLTPFSNRTPRFWCSILKGCRPLVCTLLRQELLYRGFHQSQQNRGTQRDTVIKVHLSRGRGQQDPSTLTYSRIQLLTGCGICPLASLLTRYLTKLFSSLICRSNLLNPIREFELQIELRAVTRPLSLSCGYFPSYIS